MTQRVTVTPETEVTPTKRKAKTGHTFRPMLIRLQTNKQTAKDMKAIILPDEFVSKEVG